MKWLWETTIQDFEAEEEEHSVNVNIKKSENLNSREYYELALSCIDMTTLNSTDTPAKEVKAAH